MAHDHIKHDLEIQDQTGRVTLQIMATLVGGALLVCSAAAQVLFDHEFYPAALGLMSALLLGAPLVWVAVKDLMRGHTHMNELVALAVMAAIAIGRWMGMSDRSIAGALAKVSTPDPEPMVKRPASAPPLME